MFEFDVYVNGRWVGTVDAPNPKEARLVSLSKFVISQNDNLTVNPRYHRWEEEDERSL